ncbi:hypothetical protein EJB05_12594, partial [Eragrostis curvula]
MACEHEASCRSPAVPARGHFNVESGFTKTEIKHWVELFFGVKVVAVNCYRLPGKGRRMGPILGHTMHYRRSLGFLAVGASSYLGNNITDQGFLPEKKKVIITLPTEVTGAGRRACAQARRLGCAI